MAIRFDGRITQPSDLAKYTELVSCAPDRLMVVPDPLGQRGYVLRGRRQMDDTLVRNGFRAEANTTAYKRIPPFVEWYEWESLFLRSEFAHGWPNPFIFLQIHDDWSFGGTPHWPPLEVGIFNSTLQILAHGALVQNPALPSDLFTAECVTTLPVVWDRWCRFVIRCDFQTDGTGSVEVWIDGVRACAVRNVYNCYPSNANLVQTGAYTGTNQMRDVAPAKNVFTTGVRVYDDLTTYADMGVIQDVPLVSSGHF